jgi:hypothetical protein
VTVPQLPTSTIAVRPSNTVVPSTSTLVDTRRVGRLRTADAT